MRSGFLAALVLGTSLSFFGGTASADSAADKATAREVATEGIKLYGDGKYEDALDRLRRAQALYDAPVHLLYIARCEQKLGQLVEASETYRTLARYDLPANAPEAWTSAVDDGQKELAALEPRLPKLTLVVDPKDPPEPNVEIDGAKVPAAVLGIGRPVNPGKHHVVVSARGFAASEADVDLAEGEAKSVPLTLVPGASPEPAAAASPGTPPQSEHSFVGFLGGIRVGVGIPTGKLFATTVLGTKRELQVSDAFQPGGGVELHAGVRIGKYFTPVLYVEGETLTSGKGFLELGKITKATSSSFGLGVIIGTPPGKFGGFGEFDVVFVNQYTVSFDEKRLGDTTKNCDVAARGGALRFGGGGVLPLASWFQLTPVALATVGRFATLDQTGCANLQDVSISSGDQRTHAMIFLGLGGDVVLGRNR